MIFPVSLVGQLSSTISCTVPNYDILDVSTKYAENIIFSVQDFLYKLGQSYIIIMVAVSTCIIIDNVMMYTY